jgi:hypothetical protein
VEYFIDFDCGLINRDSRHRLIDLSGKWRPRLVVRLMRRTDATVTTLSSPLTWGLCSKFIPFREFWGWPPFRLPISGGTWWDLGDLKVGLERWDLVGGTWSLLWDSVTLVGLGVLNVGLGRGDLLRGTWLVGLGVLNVGLGDFVWDLDVHMWDLVSEVGLGDFGGTW